jgi:hypothetical protein
LAATKLNYAGNLEMAYTLLEQGSRHDATRALSASNGKATAKAAAGDEPVVNGPPGDAFAREGVTYAQVADLLQVLH